MPTKLKLNRLDELSLVDNPANQHAKVVLAKRMRSAKDRLVAALKGLLERVTTVTKDDVQSSRTYDQLSGLQDLWDKNSTLMESIRSILTDATLTDEQRKTKVDETLAQFRADIVKAVTCKECGGTDGVHKTDCSMYKAPAPAPKPAPKKTTKSESDPDAVEGEGGAGPSGTPPAPDDGDGAAGQPDAGESGDDNHEGENTTMSKRTAIKHTDLAAANADVEKLIGELNTANDALATARKAATGGDDVTKGMTPEAKKAYEAQASRIEKLENDAANTRRSQIAAKIAKGTDADVAKLANVIKLVGETGEAFDLISTVLKQNTELKQELESYQIDADDSPAAEGTAKAELEKHVSEIRKANPKMSEPAAVKAALEQHPDLYDRLQEEEQAEVIVEE